MWHPNWLVFTSWNFGTFWNLWNLYTEPLVGTLEQLYLEPPSGTFTWNSYLEPPNLLEPTIGTLEPPGSFSWNPLLGTLTWNLGTSWNLEPLLRTSEPSKTFTWNLGTFRNLYLEPLLGTSEPRRTLRDDCPRVPQGLVWLRPQSFQLLGNY